MEFPKHEGSLILTHNEHRNVYDTAAEWAETNDQFKHANWVSDEERAKAIETDSIWTLQWYPDTPVGFYCLAASDLDVLLKAASET